MNAITEIYAKLCSSPSDINEHLPTLSKYAQQCTTVAEFGVREIVSTWALLHGLVDSQTHHRKRLVCVDITDVSNIDSVVKLAASTGVEVVFLQGDSAKIVIDPVDLLFIDTWHVYGHLKRELANHHQQVRKFIILHDTEVDATLGETVRMGWDATQQSLESGYPVHEITRGLRPAIEEFLAAHAEWFIAEHFTNNNGLTVLCRK